MTLKIVSIRDSLAVVAVPSPTIPPATTTNAWLLGDRNPIIVDPAAKSIIEQNGLVELLKDNPPSQIFLTHHHRDHIGSALFLKNHFNIPIVGHPQTESLLSFSLDHRIAEGDIFENEKEVWRAVHTPGHAPGHLCLLSNFDRTMVAGDMVAGEGTILIHPAEGSIREYIASLEKMITLNPSRLLPAHGKILSPGISILKEYIAHRKMRLTQVLSCLGNSPTTALDIARMIYTDLQEQFLPIASIQVQCGLIFLEEERLVRSQGTYWTVI